jgi:hypothetical protein
VLGLPTNEPEPDQKETGPAEEQTAEHAGRFAEWFARMKGLYEGLWGQHKDLDAVRWGMPTDDKFASIALPPRVAKALGTSADSLFVSPNNMAKQFNHHPELTAEEFFGALVKMKDCAEIYEDGPTRIALALEGGTWHKLILKTTIDFKEAYFVSLHRLSAKSLNKFRRTSKRIL